MAMNTTSPVHTTHGDVIGENRDGVYIFRGIPYGADCGGKRRFLPPLPAEDWQGVRDCTKNGPVAVQAGEGGSISGSEGFGPYFSGGKPELFGVKEERQSEDCLVLNVLTSGTDTKMRPVMVYIHGGGFATGSGSLAIGSDSLVREQDIVLVSVNHRLNVFGYLYLGAYDNKYASSGMCGMLDLVLALEWVRDNIASFGGDPGNVTIIGESGGGMKVSTLMAMDSAKGLFHKAIVESGSSPVGTVSPEKATELADKVLGALGVSPNNLDILTEIPTSQFKAALSEALTDLVRFQPVADGINLPYNPTGWFRASDLSKDIPLMVGSSEDEIAAFLVPESEGPVTWENLAERLLAASKQWALAGSGVCKENVDNVIQVFREHAKPTDDACHTLLKIVSVSSFLGGGAFYQALATASRGGAPVYHYVVAYDAPHPFLPGKRYAWHTADLPLQFRVVLHSESERISRDMSAMFASFARTGDPSGAVTWPVFTDTERNTMVFDDMIRVEKDPWRPMREVLKIK